jgi:hypothetical protein
MHTHAQTDAADAESRRLLEADTGVAPWRRWGPYLPDRQWGTVREDYSPGGECWGYFSRDQARSRAYRWGEDGLLGVCDEACRLCFGLALWNGKDPILKERLFGLTGPEGNHGEDVKEHYFHLDSTPTHSFMHARYLYPVEAFPYERLVRENARRGRHEPEFELSDTGVFGAGWFEVDVRYAKAGPDDVLIRVEVTNRSDRRRPLHALPTLWFRNQWSWGGPDAPARRPVISRHISGGLHAEHPELGRATLAVGPSPDGSAPELLFTENQTNAARLFGAANPSAWVKDAFHERVVGGHIDAVNPAGVGTKAAAWHRLELDAGATAELKLRLRVGGEAEAGLGDDFDRVFEQRRREADEFYAGRGHDRLPEPDRLVARRAAAGLFWSKKFYHVDVARWLDGDPLQPTPPEARRNGRNADWRHLNNHDVLLMPDGWEYPWYAAWDLAFHCVAAARFDPGLAKDQLVLLLREWYMHPGGQIPAYEFAFGDVNPPVHAWAVWRVYKMTGPRGSRDRVFLARCFQKLLINFTWWVNRKDPSGRNLFAGGFLGLDNIGVFDRGQPLPTGGHLEQADGTAWMAFYCATMLSIALELASGDPAYEDLATKFFEHFVAISDAMNTLGGTGLWDEHDRFYHDQVRIDGRAIPLRVRSLVGLVPMLAVEVLESDTLERLPDFRRRMVWFLERRTDLPWHAACACAHDGAERRLLAIPSRERLAALAAALLDESEFLSPFGVRSLSKRHERDPFVLHAGGAEHRVDYTPGESTTGLFGGNSNWRGPIWMPLNFLIVEALERYHRYYADDLTVELPTGSGRRGTLRDAADEIRRRLASLFRPDAAGRRPSHADDPVLADSSLRDSLLFHEHFHAETGRGLGASHQTGWTALIALLLEPSHAPERDRTKVDPRPQPPRRARQAAR